MEVPVLELKSSQQMHSEKESHQKLLEHVTQIAKKKESDGLRGVVVSGYIGTGKTFFVENFLQTLEDRYVVLPARHYQQHEGIPYYGFKYGIADYISKIYNTSSKDEFQHFLEALKNSLGDSFPLLLDYVPELSLISGVKSWSAQRSLLTIENQLHSLFKDFFEFVTNYYNKSVLFFTDDLQWIDASGINLLKYLLLNVPPEKLIWIGAFRAPLSNQSFLHQFVEELHLKRMLIENIVLQGLSRSEADKFLAGMLGGLCNQNLSKVCYKLTDGNPSHLQALVDSLKQKELVTIQDGEWTCDINLIEELYGGKNPQRIVLEKIKKLSEGALEIIYLIACIGRFNKDILLKWLKGNATVMSALLNEASKTGLLEQDEKEIRFAEMHIGELIYNDLSATRKSALHYSLAELFYSMGIERLSTANIVLMTKSYNQSLEQVKQNGEFEKAALLNYQAGKIVEQDNSLDQARYFYKMSAELLSECAFGKVREHIYAVYMDRARIEYYLGEYDLAEIHLDYLLERITNPLKRAKAFELKITINNHLGRYQKVVPIIKEILAELGLELPLEETQLLNELNRLREILHDQEQGKDTQVLSNAIHSDYNEAIIKLLYVGGMGIHHTSDVLMRWAALQIMLRPVKNNISVVKAIGYVSYGRMLIISGDIEKGYDFAVKGVRINNELKDISMRCRVYGVFAFYIQPWKKAFIESKALLDEAMRAGKEAGDLIGTYILKTHTLNLHLIAGLPLRELVQWDFDESYPGTELTYYITLYQKNLVQFLKGETPVFSMPRQHPSSLAAKLTLKEEKFYRHYVWGKYYFLFGYYALAADMAKEAHRNKKLQEGSPLLPANLMTWFLSITQNWSNHAPNLYDGLKRKVNKILKSFDFWQQHSPLNYTPVYQLLCAEWNRIQGNDTAAFALYHESLKGAGDNVYHRGIVHELLGKYLLTIQSKKTEAAEHITNAINSFREWGAIAKARQLSQQFQSILPEAYPSYQEMDIETIQYELSGDLEVSSLVKKLMVLLLRISGSTHVVVELIDASGEKILYDDLSLLNGIKNSTKEEIKASIPASMILLALKSGNLIVVNDLDAEKVLRHQQSIYDRGVQSYMILPVTINGHLPIVVYLENIFAKNWYVEERVKWVRMAANQGAIILENARTHEQSIKLNDEIRKEMAEKEHLTSVLEAQKDAHMKALVLTQDNERKRIASDLHDSLGSLLSSVRLRFNGLQETFTKNVPEKAVKFNDTLSLLDDSIQELRKIAHNMLPVSLSRFGLKSALHTFIQHINLSEQLDVDLQMLGLEERLPESIEVVVYRICQELVQNVIKHARASRMQIQIIHHHDSLNIIVADNGKGMDTKHITPGFGFETIRSKVALYNGTFEIDSQPERGSMVLVDLIIKDTDSKLP